MANQELVKAYQHTKEMLLNSYQAVNTTIAGIAHTYQAGEQAVTAVGQGIGLTTEAVGAISYMTYDLAQSAYSYLPSILPAFATYKNSVTGMTASDVASEIELQSTGALSMAS